MSGIIVVGSLNQDLVATAPRLPGPGETVIGTGYSEHAGGKGLNQAIAAARAGAPTTMIGAVGEDAAGRSLLATASAAGVDVDAVRTSPEHSTGRAMITVDHGGENCIVVVRGANGAVDVDLADHSIIARADLVLCQLEIPLDSVAAALSAGRRSGAITMLDPAPVVELPDALLADVDIIAPNEHEIELLGGVDRLLDAGVGAVLVTLGADGAELHEPGGTHHQPSFEVTAVDTTGAGDAFRGAFAAYLATGFTRVAALPFAAAAGGLAATERGAVPSLPERSAIESLAATLKR